MDYKELMGYSKQKPTKKKEIKKTSNKNKIVESVKNEINEWSHKPPSSKRWSKSFGGKSGLTEFESLGGKDNSINEVGISVSSNPFRAWSEHSDYVRKLNRDSMWAAKSFPNKKKEAKAIQKYTQELYKLIEIIKGQAIDL